MSDFLSDGVGEKIGRTAEKPVRTIMLPLGAVSTTACSGRWFVVNGSNFYIGATVSIRTFHLPLGLIQTILLNPHGIVAIMTLEKIVAIITVISLCLLALLLNITTPATIGPIGILAVFIFGYLSSLGVVTYLIFWGSRLFVHLGTAFTIKKPLSPISFKVAYYYSTILAAAPVMLIGFQSVGSNGVYEFLLVMLFVVIGWVYITKRIR